MQVKAVAKNVRITPEKLRLVVDEVKKMPPTKAVEILDFVPKKGSLLLKKVIASAVANAKHNHGLVEEMLVFREIQIGKGIMFKRFRAGARGRARPILKRTSNIRVVIEDKKEQSKEVAK